MIGKVWLEDIEGKREKEEALIRSNYTTNSWDGLDLHSNHVTKMGLVNYLPSGTHFDPAHTLSPP